MSTSKIVDFSMCKTCRFYETNEAEEPCHECLHTPARDDGSRKPIRYWVKTVESGSKTSKSQ